VGGQGLCLDLEHDPEKWTPVFRKDHAQIKEIERDDDSTKSHPALGVSARCAVDAISLAATA
jgi:hypothetical protein